MELDLQIRPLFYKSSACMLGHAQPSLYEDIIHKNAVEAKSLATRDVAKGGISLRVQDGWVKDGGLARKKGPVDLF